MSRALLLEGVDVPLGQIAHGSGLAGFGRLYLLLGMEPPSPARADHLEHRSLHRLGRNRTGSLQSVPLVDGLVVSKEATRCCGSRGSTAKRSSNTLPADCGAESGF